MTDFSLELNEDQIQIQKWVHDFAENVVRPAASEWDEREETPWPLIQEAANIGLYSVDFIFNCFEDPTGLMLPIVNEELFWGDAGIGLSIFGSVLAVAGIAANGTPEQVMEWVPKCFGTPDDLKLAAFCFIEPDAGCGLGHSRPGGKDNLEEAPGRAGKAKRTNSQAAMATFEATRPTVGAQAVGIARAAYEYALDYAKERRQFGRAIIENQAIAFKLADMKTRIDASRLLVWRAAWMGRSGKKFEAGEGSMSKLFAGETAVWVTEQAIQILGGDGYVREHPVERRHRDSQNYTIFQGTSEIQRLVIARAISGVHIQ